MMNKLFGSHHSSSSTADSTTSGTMSGKKGQMEATYDNAKLQGTNAMHSMMDSKYSTTGTTTSGAAGYGTTNSPATEQTGFVPNTGYNSSMSSSAFDSSNTGYGASTGNTAQYGSSTMSSTQTGYGASTLSEQEQSAQRKSTIGTTAAGSVDNAMTRSEERLYVGKETVDAGKAGMKKYVTTEHVGTNVPITKERVIVEREPITEANMDKALSGPDFKESEYEVRLREERAVAQKKAVPVERVRMSKVSEQQNQYVEADLRKEHIQVQDPTNTIGEKTLGAAPGTTESYQQTRQTRQSRA